MDPPCAVPTQLEKKNEERKSPEKTAMNPSSNDRPNMNQIAAASGPSTEPVGCLGHALPLTATKPPAAPRSPTSTEADLGPQLEIIGTLTSVSDGHLESVIPSAAAETVKKTPALLDGSSAAAVDSGEGQTKSSSQLDRTGPRRKWKCLLRPYPPLFYRK